MGRATEGRDFVPLLDSVVFLPNQTEANITLQVLDDEDPERDESVFVKLISVQLIKGEQERLSKILTLLSQTKHLRFKDTSNVQHQTDEISSYYSLQFPIPLLWAPGLRS